MSSRLCNLCELVRMRHRQPTREFIVEAKPSPPFTKGVDVFMQPIGRPEERQWICWFAELPERCAC